MHSADFEVVAKAFAMQPANQPPSRISAPLCYFVWFGLFCYFLVVVFFWFCFQKVKKQQNSVPFCCCCFCCCCSWPNNAEIKNCGNRIVWRWTSFQGYLIYIYINIYCTLWICWFLCCPVRLLHLLLVFLSSAVQ